MSVLAIGSELSFGYGDGFVARGFLAIGGGLEVSSVAGGFAGFALSSAADRTVGQIWALLIRWQK